MPQKWTLLGSWCYYTCLQHACRDNNIDLTADLSSTLVQTDILAPIKLIAIKFGTDIYGGQRHLTAPTVSILRLPWEISQHLLDELVLTLVIP